MSSYDDLPIGVSPSQLKAMQAEIERLRAINADLLAACKALNRLVENAQAVIPICLADNKFVLPNDLVWHLDGPEERAARRAARDAIAKAEGERGWYGAMQGGAG